MKDSQIPISVVHQGINRFSVFNNQNMELINQEKFNRDQIAIPIHSELTDKDIKTVIESIKNGW